jgi:hypothetical protein
VPRRSADGKRRQTSHSPALRNSGKNTGATPGKAPKRADKRSKPPRDAARGKTREEVRDLYIAELRARGLDVPPEPILKAYVDLLTGHPLRGVRKLKKVLRNPFADF